MAREDIANRTRETLHRNWLFDETDVIVSGQGEQLKDTFIYNQSWWTKNSQCHSYFYKLQEGATSGHSHAYPKDREELVLGLMNRFRGPLGERGNSTGTTTYNGEFSCTDAWSTQEGIHDDEEDIGTDDYGQNWATTSSNDNDDNGYWCNDRPYNMNIPQGQMVTPTHCFEYGIRDSANEVWNIPMEQQINPWNWRYHNESGGNKHLCDCGNGSSSNGNRASGDDSIDQGYDDGITLTGIKHVINYEDIAVCNQCWSNVSDFPGMNCNPSHPDGAGNQLIAKNWMKNQPPSKERTPFRPIFLCDLRTPTNPAVPEGGFIRTAKLILTVSQQSIAWPRQGFTAEIYNLSGEATTEDANWWSYKGTPDGQLDHDLPMGKGNTLGDWYTAALRTNGSVVPWNTTLWWLPDPIHKSIFPKDNTEWTWGQKFNSGHKTDYGVYTPMLQREYLGNNLSYSYADDPHWVACKETGRDRGYGQFGSPIPWDAGGYYNQQLLVSPAYDGETSFTTNDINGGWGGNCEGYGLWSPRSWREDQNGFSNVPVADRGCSAGNWHGRASEVEGLTGCGGCIEILPNGGFTNDICLLGANACDFQNTGEYLLDGHYAGDGYYYDYSGSKITSFNTNYPVPEWTPIKKQNYKTFQIPKFTNAGYTGTYYNLTNPNIFGVGYATGGSGSYDGRGITFAIEIDEFARHSIANKNQKLHLIMKGEYKNMPLGTGIESEGGGSEVTVITAINQEAQYESAGILYLVAGHTGCRDCLDSVRPGEGAPQHSNGTYAQTKDWRTDAAQLATNFFSVDSPAPTRQIPVNFQGIGSILDWQSGDIGNITYGLQTTLNPNKEEYIYLPKPMFDPSHAFDRFNNVFDKINATDNFTIAGSGVLNNFLCNCNCDGTYRAYKKEFNAQFTKIYVTGDARLFSCCSNSSRPETFTNQVASFTGTHTIVLDSEYYIESNADSAVFENFYDDVDVQFDHSGQKAYPEFYSATEAMLENGDGGITGGGKDLLEFNITSDGTHSNNGTYTVTEAYFNNLDYGINIERLKVKEKVTHLAEEDCVVKRVNHRPRLDITYRSRHQYDRPGDPDGGAAHGN